jgi:hypothetical protein
MTGIRLWFILLFFAAGNLYPADPALPFPLDPRQHLERTCFQTGRAYSGLANLRSDVAIVYGIDPGLPARMESWRERGYTIHVMTGVSWGQYQDYLFGRFDGTNHEDEAQTDRRGDKLRHGNSRDVFYMCPGENFGKFLSVGVQRALEAGTEAIHLEEPEFWVRSGYSEGFKREWKSYYHEDWRPPHESVDAQWRASKLKYYLYRRALQQVFDHVRAFNQRTGRRVRCYVPTHSLLNYASWRIVSPESSLARLDGCDGYIAQVWTGTSRTPNRYRGKLRERTFETAFLEYGAMQNLVRATGRRVWCLNDPIEDNPNHDWTDYRLNWESTLVASLFQPEVWRYEVAPWPERVFGGRYPRRSPDRKPIPPAYATELQSVMNALNDMNQEGVEWDGAATGFGVVISDSLMFERGDPSPSDAQLSHVYGLALPLLKRGWPVTPVQLENVTAPHYLEGFTVLLLTYEGMKPLSPDVHGPLADWVKAGGVLVVCDDDGDPYHAVREWWNSGGRQYATPREHLFENLGLHREEAKKAKTGAPVPVGRGAVIWLRENPAQFTASPEAENRLVAALKKAADLAHMRWRETNSLLLRRGPYVIAAGLDESIKAEPKTLAGSWVNLFDPELHLQKAVTLTPGSRYFLLDLDAVRGGDGTVLASACKVLPIKSESDSLDFAVEGVADTPAVVLLRTAQAPGAVTLADQTLEKVVFSATEHLLWVRFANQAKPRTLSLSFGAAPP